MRGGERQNYRGNRMPKLENRRGVTLVLMVFMLTVLIGSAAFVVDFGRMYLYRTQLHSASDAGALAGIYQVLLKAPLTATDSAQSVANRQAVGPTMVSLAAGDVIPGTWLPDRNPQFVPTTWTDPGLDAVEVTTRYTSDFGFGKIFGLTNHQVTATSQAVMGYVGATTCVRPVAIPYQALLNQIYPPDPVTGAPTMGVDHDLNDWDVQQLKDAGPEKAVSLKLGTDATQGNFYIVNLGPYSHADQVPLSPSPNFGGMNVFTDRFGGDCSHSPWTIGPGDWLQGKTGNADGPTASGFQELCGVSVQGPGTYQCTNPSSPDDVKIKIAMWATENDAVCTPRCFQVRLIGVFVVTGYTKSATGTDDGIAGYFSSIPSSGTLSMTPSPIQKIGLVK